MLTPTGHPVSPRWRWLLTVCAVLAVVAVVAAALSPWPYPPYPNDTYFAQNPLALEALDDVGALGDAFAFPLVVIGFVSLVVRFRRAEGVERDQLKLIAFAGVAVVAVMASAALLALTGDLDSTDDDVGEFLIGDAIFILGVTSLAAAIGLGIVRYRLYGLDRLMSRTLAYLSIAIVLGAGYVAIVVVTTQRVATGGSIAVTALAAGLAAAIAQPLRANVEAWLERRIFQSRATSSDVMDGFARELAATPTSTNVLRRIAEAAQTLTGARAARVEFIGHDGERLTSIVGERNVDDWHPAIRLHEGPVLLGELFVSAGDVGPSSRTALDQLTSVSTAAMATLRLQHELDALYAATQAGNRELAASRRRLIDAAEREREELRLLVREQVAPDVAHLRRALTAAANGGATPPRADDLVEAANRIASTVRSIARGVLPSVLTDHGLVAAVRADLRRVDADVVFEVDPRVGVRAAGDRSGDSRLPVLPCGAPRRRPIAGQLRRRPHRTGRRRGPNGCATPRQPAAYRVRGRDVDHRPRPRPVPRRCGRHRRCRRHRRPTRRTAHRLTRPPPRPVLSADHCRREPSPGPVTQRRPRGVRASRSTTPRRAGALLPDAQLGARGR